MASWFNEGYPAAFSQRIQIDREIERGRTDYQDYLVFENATLGRVLVLDQVVQTTEADEFFYHEMLVHVPAIAHGAVREALVVGGADGGSLRRVLEHGPDRVTMIDIDAGVVDLARRLLPTIGAGAFEDARTDLMIGDGAAFVAETERRFDLIVVDSTDPIGGPADVLFERPFYADCKRCLKPGGVLTFQAGNPFAEHRTVRNTYRHRRDLFADAGFYASTVPTYYGGPFCYGWSTDDVGLRHLPVAELAARIDARGLQTRHYNAELHAASFALPTFIRELLTAVDRND